MRLKRPFIAAVLLILSSACRRGEANVLPITPYLPAIQADSSDLDVRDAQNRPVKTAAAIGELVGLFQQNSVLLLLQQTPHVRRTMELLISSFSHLNINAFLKSFARETQRFEQAILRVIRRVVHNVHNLWITSSVDTWHRVTFRQVLTLSNKPQKLFLRC